MMVELDYCDIFNSLIDAVKTFAEMFIEECRESRIDYDYVSEEIGLCKQFIEEYKQYDVAVMDSSVSWDELAEMEKELWELSFKVLKGIWKKQL